MPATPEDLFRRLDELGIATTTISHVPLNTVEEAMAVWGELPGGRCKNLLLRDKKKRNWLVVTLAEKPIDLKVVKQRIGAAHLSFASAERLLEFLGVAPGAVTPFALINDPDGRVNVVLDAEMLEYDWLSYHPLDNAMTTTIARDDLLAFVRACGHHPMIVAL